MGFFPLVDEINELAATRFLLPEDYRVKYKEALNYFMPMNHRFGVTIGAEHSMYHSR